MLLDADLKGLRADDVEGARVPVLTGAAGVSMSLRQNSLALFHAIGIDFVSGRARAEPRALLNDVLHDVRSLPRFGVEVFMNKRIIAGALPVAVANWTGVTQSRKTEKLGFWRGVRAEWRMLADPDAGGLPGRARAADHAARRAARRRRAAGAGAGAARGLTPDQAAASSSGNHISACPARIRAPATMPSCSRNPFGANTMIVEPCSKPPISSPLAKLACTGISFGPR